MVPLTVDMELLTVDNALKVMEILSIIGGGALVAFKLGRTTAKVESSLEIQNDILKLQASDISSLKTEMKKLGDVLTAIAVQGNRIDRIEEDIREIRHGRGFVQPI